MKKISLTIAFVILTAGFLSAHGFFVELGTGYNYDKNDGPFYFSTSQGSYVGAGAGYSGLLPDGWNFSFGVNIDFLIGPETDFVRVEQHYQVGSTDDGTSIRLLPYLEVSRMIRQWLYLGFGVGYGYNSIYFGIRPLQSDTDYTSYQLSNSSFTPILFIRIYPHGALYLSLKYEVDIVIGGEIERLSDKRMANFGSIDGSTDMNGVHHRARLVIGYSLGSP